MKAVLQRVTRAAVAINGQTHAEIAHGMVILLAVHRDDEQEDIAYLAHKILNLRIFADAQQRFNLSVRDISGSLLIIPQFTLFAATRKGNRPSFSTAAGSEKARRMTQAFLSYMQARYEQVFCGVFQAHMQVSLTNDGPVTIIIDSQERKRSRRAV